VRKRTTPSPARFRSTRSKSSRSKSTRWKSGRAPASRARPAGTARGGRRWSQRVTAESDALDLRQGVFALKDPRRIATSLKRSAEQSSRRKSVPYRSAMSMLTFYINRAGKTLPPARRRILQRAKDELRKAFGREQPRRPGRQSARNANARR